jgi:glutaredoxin
MEIAAKSRMRTVPQIWLWEECLGGYSDIATLHEQWELVKKLGI